MLLWISRYEDAGISFSVRNKVLSHTKRENGYKNSKCQKLVILVSQDDKLKMLIDSN